MTERAPDLVGPILGWRVWRIAVDGELVSAYTPAGWPARAPIVARCYEHPGQHDAPFEQCVCGVYACDDANAALFYAHRSGLGGRRPHEAVGPRRRARGRVARRALVPRVGLRAARALRGDRRRRGGAPRLALRRRRCTSSRSCAACCTAPARRARAGRAISRCRRCRSGSPAGCGRSRSRASAIRVRRRRPRSSRRRVRPGRAPAPARRPAALTGALCRQRRGHRILDRLDHDHPLRLADLHPPMLPPGSGSVRRATYAVLPWPINH